MGSKKIFPKYGHATYHWKAVEEWNNFYIKTICQNEVERTYKGFETKEVGK